MTVSVYTDGAYSPVRDQGGIGLVFLRDGKKVKEYCKMFPNTTNNRMELSAVIVALKSIKLEKVDKVEIFSDSQYVIGCATKGWKRNKNQDLWLKYDQVVDIYGKASVPFEIKWVKGHESDPNNNLADKLAVRASQETSLEEC